ncbi:hypothetical protein LTR10_000281 [Elasticomyces elasticus]|nr:hypothetical protein LTR10_000281 [Elasticomyces elasticus]KAK4980462.1 hypothetical protein LTR42_000769 [Elasticomyces elasticus]
MRLLKLGSQGALEFVECIPGSIPHYAILSHTWGEDKDEVTFDDICNQTCKDKVGYGKINFCSQQAQKDGLDHFWVDTCCISKTDFTEVHEAINSMFGWYQRAEKCYTYLADVSSNKRDHQGQPRELWDGTFSGSRWFTRGWTLQELLAPASVEFFSREGTLLGSKRSLGELVQATTGIPVSALRGEPLSKFTVETRMQWAGNRVTRKIEDRWYSLLGLFDVNMSLIYGEGEKAASRLKDEIAKSLRERMDTSKRDHGTSDPSSSAADRRDMLLDSLAFEQMDSRRATIKAAYAKTCQWFVDHPAYLAWLDPGELDQHQGFLWVKGKPGAGKSTLMKFAHAHALKKTSENELLISFFFNARGEELERSVIGMYRSLLWQLLQKAPDLHSVLGEVVDSRNDQSQKLVWTIESLRELFVAAAKALNGRRLNCFIDALDECDEDQVQDMVDCFQELGQHILGEVAGHHIHICFASRHYPAVHIEHGLELTLEHEEGHSNDLAKYVRKRLRAGRGKNIEDVRVQLRAAATGFSLLSQWTYTWRCLAARICEKANGVFMWAVLVVEILNKEFLNGRTFAVKKRLEQIPSKLSDLFKDILRRDVANMDDLLLCLQWILFARRPLKREEFYYAMAAGLDPGPESLTEWNSEQVTTDDMDRYVLSSSKGLAELTKSKAPTVQFIHESVRDFLIKDDGMHDLWPNLESNLHGLAHDRLKCCCESYIAINSSPYGSLKERQSKASSETAKKLRANLARKYPFLEYAGQYLLYHADEAALVVPQTDFLNCIALGALIELRNVFERYDKRRYTAKASLPYILAEGGYARLIRSARENGAALYARGERYQFPFFAALACGHRHVVDALLESDTMPSTADLTEHMELGRNSLSGRSLKYYTPLLWAMARGHEAAAERLAYLTETCDIESHNALKQSALSLAAEKGYLKIVNLLFARKADVNACDGGGRSPLSYAVHSSNVEIARVLLENGAIVNNGELRRSGDSDLARAAQTSNETMVRLLLEHGAAISGSGALHAATSERMVELLLELGADVNEWHNLCQPIQAAAWHGQEGIVRLLIKNLADVNSMYKGSHSGRPMYTRHGPALEEASSRGHEAIVRLLLENSADVNTESDTSNRTALLAASDNGHEAVVHLLLENSARVDVVNQLCRTALHTASLSGHRGIVVLLLSYPGWRRCQRP